MLWSTIKSCAPNLLWRLFWLLTNLTCDDGKEQYLDLMIGVCIASKVGVFCSGIGENAILSTNGELGESKIDSSCYIMTTDEKGTQSQIVYKQHRSHQNLGMVFVAYWTTDTISDLWVICRVRPCESWARAERCVSVILYQVFTRDVCIQKEA